MLRLAQRAMFSDRNVAGTTTSSNFPPSSNAFQQTATFGPNQTHGFLSVVNVATGSTGNVFTLSYSTFLAGNASNGNLTENDAVTGLAVDSSFNAYVTGTTTSIDVITGFPSTPNAFQICPFEPAQKDRFEMRWGLKESQ